MKDVLTIVQLEEQLERRKRILDTLLSTDAPKAAIEKAEKSLLLTQRRLERAQAADYDEEIVKVERTGYEAD